MNPLRIMFVDDDEVILMLTGVTLRRLGHLPEAFGDARQAAARFAADPSRYDLVVCDVRLDGASGFELAAQLRSIRPDAPIVMISGAVSDADVERAHEVGALAVLQKSDFMTDLPTALGRFVPPDR